MMFVGLLLVPNLVNLTTRLLFYCASIVYVRKLLFLLQTVKTCLCSGVIFRKIPPETIALHYRCAKKGASL